MATFEKSWLCDYDLPKNPTARRVQFYRVKKRLILQTMKENSQVRVFLSTMSVLLTNDESLARNLKALAEDFAATRTHCYQLNDMQEIEEWPQ